jgi:hypothetical protein
MRPDRLGALLFQIRTACLPAIATIAAIAAATTVTAASATTAATPSAATAAPTTVTSAAPAATTATTLSLGTRFIHDEVPPAKILTVQGVDSAVRVFIVGDFDECESARLPGETVADEIDARGSNTNLRKPLVELLFRRGKRKIPNIELLHLLTPSARNPSASRGAR